MGWPMLQQLQQAKSLAHLLAKAAAELLQGSGDVVHTGVQDRLHHDLEVLSLLAAEVLQGKQVRGQHGHCSDMPSCPTAQLQQTHKNSLSGQKPQPCVKCWL